MKLRNFAFIHILLFIVTMIFSSQPWPYLMLTVAQLIYIPIVLRLVVTPKDWLSKYYYLFATPAYVAVILLQVTNSSFDWLLAGIYFSFTIVIALYGFTRFLKRGFTHLEEFMIDAGLIYLAMGGGWFFAFVSEINLGFSPLITWLTAIHFHYSAFLLLIFIGLLGRVYSSKLYNLSAIILLASPMIVAVGITFSRWIELASVLLYIFGLYSILYITCKATFNNHWQKWLVRLSIVALGVTILFSLLYALGNGFGLTSVDIDFMLRFHGLLNCLIFAIAGVIGWAIDTPSTSYRPPTFPVSKVSGKPTLKKSKNIRGLVDDMSVYEPFVKTTSLSKGIIDFYVNTVDYRLFAKVGWHRWFKPFALFYKVISRKTEQINLPIHADEIEMTGAIYELENNEDGRENVRVWLRKVKEETAFLALYSQHITAERMYMNIALPLPFSSMIGILQLNQVEDSLQLTSRKPKGSTSDAGIYLTTKRGHLFALPFTENFVVKELENGRLMATHQMWLFSIPFLTINYTIVHKPFVVG